MRQIISTIRASNAQRNANASSILLQMAEDRPAKVVKPVPRTIEIGWQLHGVRVPLCVPLDCRAAVPTI